MSHWNRQDFSGNNGSIYLLNIKYLILMYKYYEIPSSKQPGLLHPLEKLVMLVLLFI